MKDYAFLADVTAITHATILIALVVGLLVSFRYKRLRPLEAGGFLIIILGWSYFGNCPLVILEQYLRDMAGQHANLTSVGFIPYYANKFLAMEIPSRIVQRTVYFTGGALFAGSIEMFAPLFHYEVFRLRKSLRKLVRN